MKTLTPYPTPSKKQDKLVHGLEVFTNSVKKISRVIELPFYPISYPISKLKTKMSKRDWQKREQSVPKDELIPPQNQAVHVANNNQAMDQNFFYILKNGRIWFKPIAAPVSDEGHSWVLFGADGLPPNCAKISAISSDGRNLVALDGSDTVYYVHTDGINFFVTDNSWQTKDIKLEWTDRWYAIPLINKIVGIFRDKHLKLPENWLSFAISQKGPETVYYTDMSGKKHPDFWIGVTTLYVLTKDGRIFFADPWLGNGFCNEITAPLDGQFVAERLAAAASTIFLFRRDETGRAHMYTRYADVDSTGSNPLLPASYDADNQIPLIRRLPAEDWIKQPDIPLEGQARLTSQIAIIQTGRGQHNRQLRVEGTNTQGLPGYYFKNIYDNKWQFELTPGQILEFTSPPNVSCPPSPPVDLNGNIFTKKKTIPLKRVEIKKFLDHGLNERGLHTVIELTLNNGRTLTLPLYARRGVAHLFGQRNTQPYWKLVMPKEYELDEDPEVKATLKVIFHHKTEISVFVNEFENGDIELFNKHRRFKFEFNATAPYPNQFYSNSYSSGLSMFSNNASSNRIIDDKEEAHILQHDYCSVGR